MVPALSQPRIWQGDIKRWDENVRKRLWWEFKETYSNNKRAEQKLFGYWESNPSERPKSITSTEVKGHLKESKGKNLPPRAMRPKGSGLPEDSDLAQGFIRLAVGDGQGNWIEKIPLIGPAIKGLREQKERIEKGSSNTGQTKQGEK